MAKTLEGLHPTLMRPRVEALLDDPDARWLGLYLVSGFRSDARQLALWLAAVIRYGSPAKARKWVAPPGRSKHGPRVDGFGTAVDLGLPGVKAVSGQWPPALERQVNFLATKHGLFSPMEWEDWHFEPIPSWTAPEEDDLTEEQDQMLRAMNHELVSKDGRLARAARAAEANTKAIDSIEDRLLAIEKKLG